MDEVGVAVDEARRDQPAAAVDPLGAGEFGRQAGPRTGIEKPAVARRKGAVAHQTEARRAGDRRHQAGVDPHADGLGPSPLPTFS